MKPQLTKKEINPSIIDTWIQQKKALSVNQSIENDYRTKLIEALFIDQPIEKYHGSLTYTFDEQTKLGVTFKLEPKLVDKNKINQLKAFIPDGLFNELVIFEPKIHKPTYDKLTDEQKISINEWIAVKSGKPQVTVK